MLVLVERVNLDLILVSVVPLIVAQYRHVMYLLSNVEILRSWWRGAGARYSKIQGGKDLLLTLT